VIERWLSWRRERSLEEQENSKEPDEKKFLGLEVNNTHLSMIAIEKNRG
jgi:hypothetical protein